MTVERGHRAWQAQVEGHLDPARLATDLATVAAGGGGPVQVWVSQPTADDDDVAAAAGLAAGRDLQQLRVPLPVEAPPALALRPFEPGRDEAAWLDVNNRAFAAHPEQGGWTLAILREHLAEPWVDLEGFLLHEREGRLAGFCWTKVHAADHDTADHDAALGEIYVIAVDPDLHGSGLGRALTLAGLGWLHRARGIGTGMLYVDTANAAAMHVYERIGFRPDHLVRAYTATITAPARR